MEFILGACAGKLVAGSRGTLIKRITTDSRAAQPGDLFVALAGERHDGHAFLPDVIQKGVDAVMVEANKVPAALPKCAVIAVDNTRKALGQVAARYRSDFDIPVVAVGLITEPQQAEAIVSTGDADLVALARAMLFDPRWPWRAAPTWWPPCRTCRAMR